MIRSQTRIAPTIRTLAGAHAISLKTAISLALALSAAIPFAAEAHKPFIVPSETVLSRTGWITVDGAVGNDLFYFNHAPLRLDNLKVIGPDGQPVEIANPNTGKFRSTFEVNLATPGTYKIFVTNSGINGQYETAAGERKRFRGSADGNNDIPADAKNVQITQQQSRNETFVTAGKPNDTALKPTGVGLELVPVTHPNDLFAGEPISFKFLLDGKPAPDLEVEVVPGATRYRNKQNDSKFKTDKDGILTMTWNDAGMYWLEASIQDDKTSVKQAKSRRASYVATFEVLPP